MSNEQSPTHRVRKVRRDKGQVKWTPRDLAVLQWIGEQYLVRLDHLQVLLGRQAGAATKEQGRVARKTASNTVARWSKAGVVEAAQILAYQPAYVWLTRQGLTLVQLPFPLWTPKEGVAHYQAINQVRLMVEQRHPAAIWRSERHLNRERPFTRSQSQVEHRPDAELLIGAQTVAIEVERSAKTPQRLPAILYGLARRYDGIWYFCPLTMQEPMQRAFAQLDPAVRRKFSLVPLP